MKPTKQQQLEALCKSITDILWKVGENEKVIVCLPQEKSYVPHSLNYFQDNITEKVRTINRALLYLTKNIKSGMISISRHAINNVKIIYLTRVVKIMVLQQENVEKIMNS